MGIGCTSLIGVATILLASSLNAQAPQDKPALPSQPLITLHANARQVVVDVVVTDKQHQPIRGLKASNFTLLEDGTPQTLASFAEHSVPLLGDGVAVAQMPELPPGVFTNYTPAPVSAAVNVLLLDGLNTPPADQSYLRQEILRYLSTAGSGSSIAIFGLNQRLTLLQGFNSDPAILRAAAAKQLSGISPLLDQPGGPGQTISDPSLTSSLPGDVQASLSLFESQVSTGRLQLRAKLTLDAINQLARYLASIPGRKNLIWFSGDFPIELVAGIDPGTFSPFLDAPTGEAEYRDTINLLTRAQVAVYPVDARGVNSVNLITGTTTAAVAGRSDLNAGSGDTALGHAMMRRMAEDTGGEPFVNTNNLAKAFGTAIADGSNFYTLTYTPSSSDWNGRYRKIKVEVTPKPAELAYRRGYYAADPDSRLSALTGPEAGKGQKSTPQAPPLETAALQTSMVHGLPGSTQIVFKIRVLPAGATEESAAPGNLPSPIAQAQSEKGFTRYVVDFNAEAHDFTFTPVAGGKFHCMVEVAGLVFDQAGRTVNAASRTLVADLTLQQHALILQSGLPFRLQLSVPNQGTHSMRFGIEDLLSGRTGAIELPVSAVSGLPRVNVARGSAPEGKPELQKR